MSLFVLVSVLCALIYIYLILLLYSNFATAKAKASIVDHIKYMRDHNQFSSEQAEVFRSMYVCECMDVLNLTAEYLKSIGTSVGVTTAAAGPVLTLSIAITVRLMCIIRHISIYFIYCVSRL